MPATPKTSDLALLVRADRERESSDSIRVRYSATIVLVERVEDMDSPSGERLTPRNILRGYDTPKTAEYDGLTVHAYRGRMHSDQTGQSDWGQAVSYRDAYDIDCQRAEAMTATLRKIERKLESMRAEHGSSETFGEYAVRVALALGVRRFAWAESAETSTYSLNRYRFADASAFRHWLANRVAELDRETAAVA